MARNNFETSMKRLEEIVRELEQGDLPLEESLKAFEEGMTLIKFCSKKLEEVEQKVTMLVRESEAGYVHRPFDMEKDEGD